MNRQNHLTEFFRHYARASLGGEPERLAEFYEGSFLAAGPRGGAAFNNDASFLEWLRTVHAFNLEKGMRTLEVVDVAETPLSDDYILARVTWAATFQKTGEQPIEFGISYILRRTDDGPRVAAYIAHEDQEEVMKAYRRSRTIVVTEGRLVRSVRVRAKLEKTGTGWIGTMRIFVAGATGVL